MIGRVMIVVAAGASVRFGGDKTMAEVAGLPLVAHSVAAVIDRVDRCLVVCRVDQIEALRRTGLGADLVPGGPTRTASEMAGLGAIGEPAALIGIHDGARPLVSPSLVDTLFETAEEVGGAVPIVEPLRPLIRRTDLTPVGDAALAQTPQVFRGEPLLAAYVAAAKAGYEGHDTAEIVQHFSQLDIVGVPGDPMNLKVTRPDDLDLVRSKLEASRNGPR